MSAESAAPQTLLIMTGTAVETIPFSANWQYHIEKAVHEALPVFMIQIEPVPMIYVQIERQWRSEVQAMIKALQQESALAPLLAWCTFFASDPTIAESFLLIQTAGPAHHHWTIRFQHARHWEMLEAIQRSGQLALLSEPGQAPITLQIEHPDLQIHLDRVRAYQREHPAQQAC